jgi:hypothetical protein
LTSDGLLQRFWPTMMAGLNFVAVVVGVLIHPCVLSSSFDVGCPAAACAARLGDAADGSPLRLAPDLGSIGDAATKRSHDRGLSSR